MAYLEWSQVDWGQHVIRTVGKGGKQHITPIVGHIETILRACKGHHPTRVFTFEAVKGGRNPRSNISYEVGHRYPMNYQTMGTMWTRFREEAKVPDARIHDLRHTFASRLLRESRDLRLVQQAMAHSDIAMTERYTSVLQDSIGQAMLQAQQANDAILERRRAELRAEREALHTEAQGSQNSPEKAGRAA